MSKELQKQFPHATCSQRCVECDRGDDHLCTDIEECQCTHVKRFPSGWDLDVQGTTNGMEPLARQKLRRPRRREPVQEQYPLSFLREAEPIPRGEPSSPRIPNKSAKRGRRRSRGLMVVIVAF